MSDTNEVQSSSQNNRPRDDQTRKLSRLEALVVALVLFIIGIALITVGAIVPQHSGLVYEVTHHVLRDLGIAAIISALLGTAYEYILRSDFLKMAQRALSRTVEEERNWLRAMFVADAQESLTIVLNERDDRLQQLDMFHVAGLTGIRETRHFETIEEKLKSSPKQVRILETWTGHRESGIDKLIRGAVENGTEKVEILLLNPESDQVGYRAKALDEDVDEVRSSIKADLVKLQKVRLDGHKDKIELRVYDASPSVNMFSFDDFRLMGLYLRGFDSIESTQFSVSTRDRFLAVQLDRHFENLWTADETIEWPPEEAKAVS